MNGRLSGEMCFCLTDGMDLLCAAGPVSPSVSHASSSSHRPLAAMAPHLKRHSVVWDNLEKSVSVVLTSPAMYCMMDGKLCGPVSLVLAVDSPPVLWLC